jgi:hypothetical protein
MVSIASGVVAAHGSFRPCLPSEPFVLTVTGAARAEVDVTRIDHGAVAFNQPVESIYRVRAVGDQPLRILGEPRVELVEGC